MRIANNGKIGIGTATPYCNLEVNGLACINNGSPWAVVNSKMQSGSLTIGGTNADYGWGTNGWTNNGNVSGLLLECLNIQK